MEKDMKTFTEIREAAAGKTSYHQARKWVFHHLDNTDHTHDQMKKNFHKKFGKQNQHHFDKAVSEYMD
jgi:hypothetical protein